MSTPIVYFTRNPENDHVRIGSDGKGSNRRTDAHAQYGFSDLLALIHGDDEDEKKIHQYFTEAGDLVPGRKSVYRGDRVYEYISWLIARTFAVGAYADLDKIPRLPWNVWAPAEYRADEHYAGQLSLLAALPPRERVAQTNRLAYLNSESDEWNTPIKILDAARATFLEGVIDTDPASNFEAQRFVQARCWYSKAQNGLRTDLPWTGATWLNPPYGIGDTSAGPFVQRLVEELRDGNVTEAITNLNVSSITTNWFAPVWRDAISHIVYKGRPDYWKPGATEASSPNKGTIFSYFGQCDDRFREAFASFGYPIQVVGR